MTKCTGCAFSCAEEPALRRMGGGQCRWCGWGRCRTSRQGRSQGLGSPVRPRWMTGRCLRWPWLRSPCRWRCRMCVRCGLGGRSQRQRGMWGWRSALGCPWGGLKVAKQNVNKLESIRNWEDICCGAARDVSWLQWGIVAHPQRCRRGAWRRRRRLGRTRWVVPCRRGCRQVRMRWRRLRLEEIRREEVRWVCGWWCMVLVDLIGRATNKNRSF